MNRYAESEKALNEALQIAETSKYSYAYVHALCAKASYYRQTGQYLKAEELYHTCDVIFTGISFGTQSSEYAAYLNDRGLLYEETGRYEMAEQYYQYSLQTTSSSLGKDHADYATTLDNLGPVS